MPPEDPEFRLEELVSFRVRGSAVEVQAPGGRVLLLAPRMLPLLARLAEWTTLPELFLRLPPDKEWPVGETVAVLRELIACGVLVAREAGGPTPPADPARRIWDAWGSAPLAYHLASRTSREQPYSSVAELDARLREKALDEPQPSSYKDYDSRPFHPFGDPVREVRRRGADDFVDVLLRRRTWRRFSGEPLAEGDLAALLYLTWGATSTTPNTMGQDVFLRKTSPSGGSLHPVEVYPVLMNVDGLDSGVYHYSVRRHGLELLSPEDPRDWIVAACGGQEWVTAAAAVFVSSAVLYRAAWKYQSARTLRVVLADVGHLSQTFCLSATWLGHAPFTTGALRDEIFEERIGLSHLEEPVLLLNGVGASPP